MPRFANGGGPIQHISSSSLNLKFSLAAWVVATLAIVVLSAGRAQGFTLITTPQTFEITATPTDSLTNVHFLYHATTNGGDSYVVDSTLANMAAHVQSVQFVTVLIPEIFPTDQTYSVAGTYDAANDVTIGVNPTTDSFALGPPAQTWDATFVTAPNNFTSDSEATVGTALAADDDATLDGLFGDIQGPTAAPVGTPTFLVNFTTATIGGTALAVPVPEPALTTLLIFFAGALISSRFIRRIGFT